MTLQCISSVAPMHATVRVRMPEAIGVEPEQLLTLIKAHIPKAVAVRVLHSSNIEVMFPNQQAKDQTITQRNTPGCKILRQDYPVEVIGVPLNTPVESRQGTTNTQIIQKITEATKKLALGITITRVVWLNKEHRTHIGETLGFQKVKM